MIILTEVPCNAYIDGAQRGVACTRGSNKRRVRLLAWRRLDLNSRTFLVPEHTVLQLSGTLAYLNTIKSCHLTCILP